MCGVVGILGTPDAAREAFLGLTTLQHRGQDAAGILSYDAAGFHRVKNLGLVEAVFTRDNMATLTGEMAVGHARYSTIGRGDLVDVQPFLLSYPFGIGMVHNGNIVNVGELASDLKNKAHRHLLTQSDTEVVLNLLADGLARADKARSQDTHQVPEHREFFEMLCASMKEVYERVQGSYSIVTLVADQGLVAFRDPNGIRPLVWGKRPARRDGDASMGTAHMLASESVALGFLGYKVERHLQPGELLFIDRTGGVHSRVIAKREHRPCMFELVYFASPESDIDGAPVYGSRIALGRELGQQIRAKIASGELTPDIIVPVPETSRIAAIALSEELNLPYREVLIKNRYIKRTFILDSQEKRQKAVDLKLSPVRSEIEGKNVLLVDDSIVRGTTSRKIIELVRRAGAKAVYFVSTCPPIQHPCYYGIDFPSESELIAQGRSIEAIRAELGADALIYQDIAGLKRAVGNNPCMACLDGKYPTDISGGRKMAATRERDRAGGA